MICAIPASSMQYRFVFVIVSECAIISHPVIARSPHHLLLHLFHSFGGCKLQVESGNWNFKASPYQSLAWVAPLITRPSSKQHQHRYQPTPPTETRAWRLYLPTPKCTDAIAAQLKLDKLVISKELDSYCVKVPNACVILSERKWKKKRNSVLYLGWKVSRQKS